MYEVKKKKKIKIKIEIQKYYYLNKFFFFRINTTIYLYSNFFTSLFHAFVLIPIADILIFLSNNSTKGFFFFVFNFYKAIVSLFFFSFSTLEHWDYRAIFQTVKTELSSTNLLWMPQRFWNRWKNKFNELMIIIIIHRHPHHEVLNNRIHRYENKQNSWYQMI